MKRLLPLLFLAACGAQPAPEFMLGAQRADVQRNGRDFTVFHTESRVEVIRLGFAGRGEHQAIRADMEALVADVTGCTLDQSSVVGDSGEMRASILC